MRISLALVALPLLMLACSSPESSSPVVVASEDGGVDASDEVDASEDLDAGADTSAPEPAAPVSIVLETDMGDIEIELDPARAPVTVANFLTYVDEKHYDGTVFHRVIPDFMIQGGGFDADDVERSTHDPITNEADNGLKNVRGTIAMARTSAPHSATAQFFINVVDNTGLDFTAKTVKGWGYAVFGKVTAGMDVADQIVAVPTGARGKFKQDAPLTPVVIKSAHRR